MDNSPTYKVHQNFFNVFSYYANLKYENRKTYLLLLLHMVLFYLITVLVASNLSKY